MKKGNKINTLETIRNQNITEIENLMDNFDALVLNNPTQINNTANYQLNTNSTTSITNNSSSSPTKTSPVNYELKQFEELRRKRKINSETGSDDESKDENSDDESKDENSDDEELKSEIDPDKEEILNDNSQPIIPFSNSNNIPVFNPNLEYDSQNLNSHISIIPSSINFPSNLNLCGARLTNIISNSVKNIKTSENENQNIDINSDIFKNKWILC